MKKILLLLLAWCLSVPLFAQDVPITGKVIDQSGEPLIGASVKVKGSSQGVVTDTKGAFALKVADPKGTLTVSYIGYNMLDVDLKNNRTITVTLTAQQGSLDEVVVVAYGTQKRANLTGAVSTVVAKDLVKNSNNDVTNTLTGRAPGVRVAQLSSQPGKFDSQIDIRGFSYVDPNDVEGNQQGGPLFIIDGVQRDKSGFDHLDPNEIESVSVLKDATAAIYGVKAANGVILVTTKKGKQGAIQVAYTMHLGKQFITKYPELSSAYQYATLFDEQQINNFISGNQQITPPQFTPQQIEDFRTGKTPSTDFLKAILNNSTSQQQHNVTVSGGNEKLRFFVSGGYFDEGGLLKTNIEYGKKYNFRTAVDGQLGKGLTFSINLGLNNVMSKSPNTAIWSLMKNAWSISPTQSLYSNGDTQYLNQFYNQPNDNPLGQITENLAGYNKTNDKALTSTFSLNYELPFVEGLSIKGLFAYDNSYTFNRSFRKQFYQYQYDNTTQLQTPFSHQSPSQLNEYFGQGITNDLQLSLNYNHRFGKSNVSGLLIYEQIYRQGNSNNAQTQFVIDAIDQLSAGNRATDVVGSGYSQSGNRSYAGKFNYDYAGKYLAEFGFREDGSSYFPTKSRWGFFPYGSVGWRISEESFIKDKLKFVDNIKLRATYGKEGDDQAAANTFAYLTGYIYPSSGSGSLAGSVFGPGFVKGVDFKNAANANITWYTSTQTDIGLDFSLWNGKLTFEGDVFRRERSGLLGSPISNIPGTYGVNLPQVNLNGDRTQGFEIVLGHRSKIGAVDFSVSGNMSYARTQNRYIEQTPASSDADNYRNKSAYRYNDIVWGYKVAGQFQNFQQIYAAPIQDGAGNRSLLPGDLNYVDLNGDNVIDGKDQTVIARNGGKPAIYFGANFELGYKGFDFSMLVQGATMYSVSYLDQLSRPFYFQYANPVSIYADRWHRQDIFDPNSPWVPGRFPSTGQRQNYKDGVPNSFSTFDGSYVRIKSIELGYTFGKKLLGRLGINRFRVFANAYNLYTFTGKGLDFIDPESSGTRLYSYSYPITLNVNAGVQATF